MRNVLALAALFVGLLASPAFAQSTAQPVLPGMLVTSGCPPGYTSCYVPYSNANPLPISPSSPAPVTPAIGTHVILIGGTSRIVVTGPVNGCYILNPLTAADEGIAVAEPAYVNVVTTATLVSTDGTSTALQPGQSFNCIPGQTTNVNGIAVTNNHTLVVVKW